MFMGFFNSLSIRIPLAVVGGILYSILTYYIVILLNLPSELALATSIIVFLFYLGSRFLILFSGIDTDYYSKGKKIGSKQFYKNTSFYLFISVLVIVIFRLILTAAIPLLDKTESRYGEIARIMYETKNWVGL